MSPLERLRRHLRVNAPRTVVVEQAALRRAGGITPRQRRRLPAEGLDARYSDSYVPAEVEYLSYAEGEPRWETLGRLGPK